MPAILNSFLFNPVVIFILFVATWRLSKLLNDEDGFLHIFTIIRHIFGVRYVFYDKQDGEQIVEKSLSLKEVFELGDDVYSLETKYLWHISQLFSCIWCMSVWVGTLLVLVAYFFPMTIFMSLVLSCSASAIFLEAIRERLAE